MLKKINALLILAIMLLTGCSDSGPVTITPDGDMNTNSSTRISHAPVIIDLEEGLLARTSEAKFNETITTQLAEEYEYIGFVTLTELYNPIVTNDMILTEINVFSLTSIDYIYFNDAGERILFVWSRHISTEYAKSAPTLHFGRGASAEYMVEQNGITYGVTEWLDRNGFFESYMVSWAQYGQTFSVQASAGFSLDDVLSFCDAQPISSWELDGDAMSVSIQGMEDVRILDDGGYEIVIVDDALYRVTPNYLMRNVITNQEMTRVGYRWLIDEESFRYQYVLEPGDYTFQAESIVSEPEILVKRFEAGEVVSSIDYTQTLKNQTFNQFDLNITTDSKVDTLIPRNER